MGVLGREVRNLTVNDLSADREVQSQFAPRLSTCS